MKVIVKSIFSDKYTGVLYNTGDVLESTESRFAEIQGVGDFLEPAPVPPVKEKKPVDGEKTETTKPRTRKAAKKADG